MWLLSNQGESCTEFCAGLEGTCDLASLRDVDTAAEVKDRAQLAGESCSPEQPIKAPDGSSHAISPGICTHSNSKRCPYNQQGICTWGNTPKNVRGCGKKDSLYSRLCPCRLSREWSCSDFKNTNTIDECIREHNNCDRSTPCTLTEESGIDAEIIDCAAKILEPLQEGCVDALRARFSVIDKPNGGGCHPPGALLTLSDGGQRPIGELRVGECLPLHIDS